MYDFFVANHTRTSTVCTRHVFKGSFTRTPLYTKNIYPGGFEIKNEGGGVRIDANIGLGAIWVCGFECSVIHSQRGLKGGVGVGGVRL